MIQNNYAGNIGLDTVFRLSIFQF